MKIAICGDIQLGLSIKNYLRDTEVKVKYFLVDEGTLKEFESEGGGVFR